MILKVEARGSASGQPNGPGSSPSGSCRSSGNLAPGIWGIATSCSRESALNTHAADPKSLRDGHGAMSSSPHFTHPLNRRRGLAAFVDTLGLRSLNPGLLALADEAALHLGHHAQHG